MAILSKASPAASTPYPKLMISKSLGTVIIFLRRGEGTVVNTGESHNRIGEHSINWDMDSFTDYDGQVVLTNDTN